MATYAHKPGLWSVRGIMFWPERALPRYRYHTEIRCEVRARDSVEAEIRAEGRYGPGFVYHATKLRKRNQRRESR